MVAKDAKVINSLCDIGKNIKEKVREVDIIDKGLPSKIDFETKKKRTHKEKESINDWSNRDFAIYLLNLYLKRYQTSWDMKATGISLQLGRLKDKIQETIGYLNNVILKDYFDFFFSKYSDYYKRRQQNVLYLNNFSEDRPLADFIDNYKPKEVKKVISNKISEKEFIMNYKLGIDNFILEYGIIITSYWISKYKNISENDIYKLIESYIQKISKDGNIKKVIEATLKYNPYNLQESNFLTKIAKLINVEIKFGKNDIFDFLKENV